MFPQQYKVDISLKPCHSSRPFSTCAKRLLKILNADTRLFWYTWKLYRLVLMQRRLKLNMYKKCFAVVACGCANTLQQHALFAYNIY